MYDFLRGVVITVDMADRMSFEVNGVGYLLRVSKRTRAAIPLDGKSAIVHVRLVVRDDDLILFGFYDIAERFCFDLLTSVQGVGPSMAMGVLSALSPDELRAALVSKDAKKLAEIKGVGPKSSERIIVELAAKADKIPGGTPNTTGTAIPGRDEIDNAIKGLVALGFKAVDARAAVSKVVQDAKALDPALNDASSMLRAALAVLR
jgi:Holliday junction DNA helicase RuvA